MEQKYRISFKIGESRFEIESTDQKWLEGKEKDYLQKLLREAPKHEEKSKAEMHEARTDVHPPGITLVEFYRNYIKKKHINSRSSIAVFFVYHLEKVMKKEAIKSGDISNCFRDISYPNWNKLNITDILNGAKRRALLNYVNKFWSLTSTGEDYVVNVLTGKRK